MDEINIKQNVMIKNRNDITIDNVSRVEALCDEYVEISSECGLITVEGSDLRIEELIQDKGTIHITGRIDGIFYKTQRKQASIFSRMFK